MLVKNIGLKIIFRRKTVFVRGFLNYFNCLVRSFALAASVGVENKFFLPNRFKEADEKMMDDTVAEISRPYFAQFRVGYGKADIAPRLVGTGF